MQAVLDKAGKGYDAVLVLSERPGMGFPAGLSLPMATNIISYTWAGELRQVKSYPTKVIHLHTPSGQAHP